MNRENSQTGTDMAAQELRPYQVEAIEAITSALGDGGSGQLYAACGSGKTLIAMRAAEQLAPPDGLIVILAPSLGLVSQILKNWLDASTGDFQRFAVCSDKTVAARDEARVDLAELGVPVSTDCAEIEKWVVAGGPRLIVGTYLSADRLAAAVRRAGAKADLLICDEAHHLAGSASAKTRRIMDSGALPAIRRLYMTATPRVGTDRVDEQRASRTLSMDDHDTFGPVLYNYPFSRAIAEGYLSDYRIAVIGVTDQEARALLGRDDIEYAAGVGMRTAAAQVALARAYHDFGMRRVISFHPTISEARGFIESFPATLASLSGEAVPTPTCLHANGGMNGSRRRQVLADLAEPPVGGWAVASNARCLSEGIDVPAVDGVLFNHAKRSVVDIVQAAGRALRKHPDTPGPSTVIVPVILPDAPAGAVIGEIDAGPYEALIAIVSALKDHDDALSADLDARRSGLASPDPTTSIVCGGPLEKIVALMPEGSPETLLASIRLMVIRRTASSWWEMHGHARAYCAENGHLRVPQKGATTKLGVWLANQRSLAQKGRLRDDRRRALEAIGIEWDVKGHAGQRRLLRAAQQFHSERGHLLVPSSYRTAQDPHYKLASELEKLRVLQLSGGVGLDIQDGLDRLGMVWDRDEFAWLRNLGAATAFRSEYGDLRVPHGWEQDGCGLGGWLEAQRPVDCQVGEWDARCVPVSPARKLALDDVGMIWEARNDERYVAIARWFARWERRANRTSYGYRASQPSGAEFRAFLGSLTALETHLSALHSTNGGAWTRGFGSDEGEAAADAGDKLEVHLSCPVKDCRFTTASNPAVQWRSDEPTWCPRCHPKSKGHAGVPAACLVDTWHLGNAMQSLYRCAECGHRWSRSWPISDSGAAQELAHANV